MTVIYISDGSGAIVLDELNSTFNTVFNTKINGHPLTSDVTLDIADIKTILTTSDTNMTALQNLSGINAGDETEESIQTKLGGDVVLATRKVNGHPLSSDVVVTASDITLGTLPYHQLPIATNYTVGAVVPDGVTTIVSGQGVISGISGANSNIRQSILSAQTDVSGNPNYITAVGLNVTINASTLVPFVASMADGFGIAGNPIDIPICLLVNSTPLTLQANTTTYFGLAYPGTPALFETYLSVATVPVTNVGLNIFVTSTQASYYWGGAYYIKLPGLPLAVITTDATSVINIQYFPICNQGFSRDNLQSTANPYSVNSSSLNVYGNPNFASILAPTKVFVANTSIAASSTITMNNTFTVGQTVMFQNNTATAQSVGLSTSSIFYVTAATGTTFSVSLVPNGTAVTTLSSGANTIGVYTATYSSVKVLASAKPIVLTHPDGNSDSITADQTLSGISEGTTLLTKEAVNASIVATSLTNPNQDLILDFKDTLNFDLYGNTVNIIGIGSQLGHDISTSTFTAGNYKALSQITAGNMNGVFFSVDGTKMYAVDRSSSIIYQYDLSTPWVVKTATYSTKSLNTSSQIAGGNLYNIFISTDGTKLYGTHITTKVVYQYTLGTPWDISTAAYASLSYTCAQVTANYFTDVCFSADGFRMYAIDLNTKIIYQYTLSAPWNVSTATYATLSYTCAQVTAANLYDIFFSADGTLLYAADGSTNIVYQYNLTTAWNVSTSVYSGKSYNASTQIGASKLRGVFISSDGSKMFTSDSNTTNTYQYNLRTGYYMAGSNSGLNCPTITTLGAGTWTLEERITPMSVAAIQDVFNSSAQFGVYVYISATGLLTLSLSSNGTAFDIASAVTYATPLVADTEYHIRLQFTGYSYVLYLNGVPITTVASILKVYAQLGSLCFGYSAYSARYMTAGGKLRDIRVTVEALRNLTLFTPPAAGTFAVDRFLLTESKLSPLGLLKSSTQNMLVDFKNSSTFDYYGNILNAVGTEYSYANNMFYSGVSTGLNTTSITTMGAGHWVIEDRVTFNNFTAAAEIFGNTTAFGIHLQAATTGKTTLSLSSNNTTNDIASATGGTITMVTGTSYHIALAFIGSAYIVFINGIVDQIIPTSTRVYASLTGLNFGYNAAASNAYLAGTITDIRISLSNLRYTNLPFVPPAIGTFVAEQQPLYNSLYWFQYGVKPLNSFKVVNGRYFPLSFTKLLELNTSNGVLATPTIYNLNTKYYSADIPCTALATPTIFNHNSGTNNIKPPVLLLRNYIPEQNYSLGDVIVPYTVAGTAVPFAPCINKNTVQFTTGATTNYFLQNKTTGVGVAITTANWRQFTTIERNF